MPPEPVRRARRRRDGQDANYDDGEAVVVRQNMLAGIVRPAHQRVWQRRRARAIQLLIQERPPILKIRMARVMLVVLPRPRQQRVDGGQIRERNFPAISGVLVDEVESQDAHSEQQRRDAQDQVSAANEARDCD